MPPTEQLPHWKRLQSVVFDPKLVKSDSDSDRENNVELQQLEEGAKSPSEQSATNASITPIPDPVQSYSVSEIADWIASRDTGSEGVLSSSTAEADDFISDGEVMTKTALTTDATAGSSIRDVPTRMEEARRTSASASGSSIDPKTASGVWRKAYHFHKKDKDHSSNENETTTVDFDPKTASGFWRKAYHVKK